MPNQNMTPEIKEKIRNRIRSIPDYPKPGILFRDITTLLKHPDGIQDSVTVLSKKLLNIEFDKIAAIDSRGFIFGAALSFSLGKGFVPVRKKNKLPGEVIREEYKLEYGYDEMELHTDAIEEGERVLLIDDLIATGGTALAAMKLIQRLGGDVVACAFILGLPEIGGMKKLAESGFKVITICDFEGH